MRLWMSQALRSERSLNPPLRRVLKTGPLSSSGTFLNSARGRMYQCGRCRPSNSSPMPCDTLRRLMSRDTAFEGDGRTPRLFRELLPPDQAVLLSLDNLQPLRVHRALEVVQLDLCREVWGGISWSAFARALTAGAPLHAVSALAKELLPCASAILASEWLLASRKNERDYATTFALDSSLKGAHARQCILSLLSEATSVLPCALDLVPLPRSPPRCCRTSPHPALARSLCLLPVLHD